MRRVHLSTTKLPVRAQLAMVCVGGALVLAASIAVIAAGMGWLLFFLVPYGAILAFKTWLLSR